MSSNEKTLLWIGVVIVAIGVIWWLTASKGVEPVEEHTPVATSTAAATGSTASPASDTSDAALNADIGAMGTQMDGFSSDSASINSGINDQPVSQQ